MKNKKNTVDVREDIRNGREPFSKIMNAVTALQPDEDLLLIAPFEPVPLFGILGKRGFKHDARLMESGDWEVMFTRQSCASPAEVAPTVVSGDSHDGTAPALPNIAEVDARGLEPPQPMVKILETLATLPTGSELHARTDRRPMHLYPHLEERGFTAETLEQTDGSFLTHIRRS